MHNICAHVGVYTGTHRKIQKDTRYTQVYTGTQRYTQKDIDTQVHTSTYSNVQIYTHRYTQQHLQTVSCCPSPHLSAGPPGLT